MKLFTKKLINGSISFTSDEGFLKVTVMNKTTSTSVGTITGTLSKGSSASEAIDIEAGGSISLLTENVVNGGIACTITSPDANCTLQIVAYTN